MCSRLLLGLALLRAGALAAQGPGNEDRLRREQSGFAHRADSLAREWREVRALAAVAESLAHSTIDLPLDTVTEGPFRIITNPSPLPLRQAARRARSLLDPLYGSAIVELADRPWQILAYDPDTSPPPRRIWSPATRVPWDLDADALGTILAATAPMPPPDQPLLRWLGGPLGPQFAVSEEAGEVYRGLVTGRFQVDRDCFAGDLAACRSALGLDPPDRVVTGRYRRPEERRRAAGQQEFYFRGPDRAPAYRACQAGDDAECRQLLGLLPQVVLVQPLPPDARRSVTRFALRTGGPDAYRRLTADAGAPLAGRLASAAGVPLDTLIGRWRADLLARRPVRVALPVSAAGIGLGWILVFGLCGLGSSRWRLG